MNNKIEQVAMNLKSLNSTALQDILGWGKRSFADILRSAAGKIPERTLQKASRVSRLPGIFFCNGRVKGKHSLCKEGNEDPSTVSQIHVTPGKLCQDAGGIQSKHMPTR